MGKKQDGTVATMELLEKLHDEAMVYQQEMHENARKIDDERRKWHVSLDELNEQRKEIDLLESSIEVLEQRIEELKTERGEAIEKFAQKRIEFDSLRLLLGRLIEPKGFLQIKMKDSGAVVLNTTGELGDAVKFAQQGETEDDCKWVAGYSLEPGISCIIVDAPPELLDCVQLSCDDDSGKTDTGAEDGHVEECQEEVAGE